MLIQNSVYGFGEPVLDTQSTGDRTAAVSEAAAAADKRLAADAAKLAGTEDTSRIFLAMAAVALFLFWKG